MAFTKRGLYKFLINNPYIFSFGKQEDAIPEPINVTENPNVITNEVNDSTKNEIIDKTTKSNGFLSNLSDAYEKSLKDHNEKITERKKINL